MKLCAVILAALLWNSFIVLGADIPESSSTNQVSAVSLSVRQLQSDDASERTAAAKALVKIGPSASDEVDKAVWMDFRDKKAARALQAFVELGSDAVPIMLGLIRGEKSGDLRHNPGISGLLEMRTNAISGLEEALRDANSDVRGSAIEALRILNMAPEIPITRLLIRAANTESNETLRIYAIDALGYIFPGRPPLDITCQTLRRLARDDHLEKARITASYSLAKACHDSSPETLSLLAEGVSGTDQELAWESAFALHFVGTNAAAILPTLTNAIGGVDFRTADELLSIVASLGDSYFPTLQKYATAAPNSALKVSAVNSLGDFASSTRTNLSQTIAILSENLKDSNPDVRRAAVNSLRRVAVERKDPKLRPIIADKLRPLLKDDDQWLPDDVKHALKEIESAN